MIDQQEASHSLKSHSNCLETRLDELNERLRNLKDKLNGPLPGDGWLRQSCIEIQKRISDFCNSVRSEEYLFWGGRKPHPSSLLDVWDIKTQTSTVADAKVLDWRRSLSTSAAEQLDQRNLKGVFDYYFRYDLYGSLRDEDTLILSRGAKELPFFSPPAAVRIALDVSNRNTWFGYSDSLGHRETRDAITRLERLRRNDLKIEVENVAVVQGGTQGLSYVLRFLHRLGVKGSFACVVPTYAPILDDVSSHFGVVTIPLDKNYRLEKALLLRSIENTEVCGLLLSLPHNPPLNEGLSGEDLIEITKRLSELGKYLIIDEVAYNSHATVLSPVNNPFLIVVHSYSKMFAVAGLKIGHLLAHQNFIDQFYRFASTSYGSPPSFLYLACTAINAFEYSYLTDSEEFISDSILSMVSDSTQLFEENRIWHLCEQLHSEVIDYLLQRILMLRHIPSIDKIHTSEPGGCNKMVSLKLKGSSYSTFLEILRRKNVSVFPIDCMMPRDDRHDIRITTATSPTSLLQGFLACCEVTDDILARTCPAKWITEEDTALLDHFGLYGIYQDFFGYGHAMRVVLRLRQILALEKIPRLAFLERCAALHDIGKVWCSLGEDERAKHWERLFKTALPQKLRLEKSDSVWGSYLIEHIEKSPHKSPSLSEHVKSFLLEFFHSQIARTTCGVEHALVDIADQTSDFQITDTPSWDEIGSLLSIKSTQLKIRYSLNEKITIEHAVRCSQQLQHCRDGLQKLKNRDAEQPATLNSSTPI